MISTSVWALAALLASAPAVQDATAGSAREAHQRLSAEVKEARADYSAKVRALQETEEWRKASEAEDRAAIDKLYESVPQVDGTAFAKRALVAARSFGGDDSIALLAFALTYARDRDVANEVVDIITKDHLESASLVDLLENGSVLGRAIGPQAAGELLTKILAENKDDQVRAWAMYWMASSMKGGRGVSDEDKTRADAMLAEAEKLAAGTMLADRIAAPRFEEERLQIGMEAPEIEGTDTDGTAFKLSDYRGKVVVLDFWGFW